MMDMRHDVLTTDDPLYEELYDVRKEAEAAGNFIEEDQAAKIAALQAKAAVHKGKLRDLLNLPEGDPGIGVIKPSGSDQTVAIVSVDRILVQPRDFPARLYQYQLGADARAERIPGDNDPRLQKYLEAFLQTATGSLLSNTAGVQDAKQNQ